MAEVVLILIFPLSPYLSSHHCKRMMRLWVVAIYPPATTKILRGFGVHTDSEFKPTFSISQKYSFQPIQAIEENGSAGTSSILILPLPMLSMHLELHSVLFFPLSSTPSTPRIVFQIPTVDGFSSIRMRHTVVAFSTILVGVVGRDISCVSDNRRHSSSKHGCYQTQFRC
jgi:hypothetical protein